MSLREKSAPALQDVLSGQADFVCDPGIAFPHIRTNKVKLLGIVSATRSPFFPDAPTVGELGFKEADLDIWFGMWAPKGTPPEILERLNKELAKALSDKDVEERYNGLGAETKTLDSRQFRQLLLDERKLLAALIEEQKINVE
ncbi:Bug family tripartite tricarboxylate transporter substrate binding protein [Parapusillimonas sp. JC17]|uniref:Bug family tripartite tricarboxylate transporter substrate binding protein n=1 Tax=Parapusillimonas sp. JC17 TaxID=3445768 RepID=UPI003FA145DE